LTLHILNYTLSGIQETELPEWENSLGKDLHFWDKMIEWPDLVVIQYIATPYGLSLVQSIRDRMPCLMECDDYFSGVPGTSLAYHSNRPGEAQITGQQDR